MTNNSLTDEILADLTERLDLCGTYPQLVLALRELQQRRAIVVTIPTIWKEYRSGKVCSIYEQSMNEAGVKWRSVDDE